MKIGLLLGAGFSYDLGMPIAKELTEVFLGLFNTKNTKSLVLALSDNQPYSADRPINKKAIAESLTIILQISKRTKLRRIPLRAARSQRKPKQNPIGQRFISLCFWHIIRNHSQNFINLPNCVPRNTIPKKSKMVFKAWEHPFRPRNLGILS